MSDSSRKESFFDGKSGARLLQGLVVGVAATLIAGFGFSDWSLPSAVATRVDVATHDATIAALAPICAERFEKAAVTDESIVVSLKAVSAWSRSEHLTKAGFVTFAGGKDPDYMVARECANMLGKSFSFE